MKKYLIILLIFGLFSCKSKAILVQKNASDTKNNDNASEKIIANYYKNTLNFSTLYIKANAKYKDEKQTQNVAAEIKIKKDEKILVSVRFLGFTVAKALITPTSVRYYEKIGSNFFDGNYETLSKWLGADLNFLKVQNLFLGKPVDDLTKEKFIILLTEKIAQLQNSDVETSKSFSIETDNYTLEKQEIKQLNQNRTLQIAYPEYQNVNQMLLPLSLEIDANAAEKNTSININYRSISVNEELSFPYNVPDGYTQIYIK